LRVGGVERGRERVLIGDVAGREAGRVTQFRGGLLAVGGGQVDQGYPAAVTIRRAVASPSPDAPPVTAKADPSNCIVISFRLVTN
jgi:hypothetical protein